MTPFGGMHSLLRIVYGLTMTISMCLSGSSEAVADDASRHWKQYSQYALDHPNIVATKMLSSFEMPGDDGPVHGHYQTMRVTDSNGKVRWALADQGKESQTYFKMAGLDLSLAARVAEDPINPFDAPDSAKMLGTEFSEQINWTILSVRGKLRGGEVPVLVKLWVHPETGRPRRVEGEVERPPLPGVKRLWFSIDYKANDSEVALPRLVRVHYEISLFFKSGVVDFSQELDGWGRR